MGNSKTELALNVILNSSFIKNFILSIKQNV